jgi:predicted RNase H-like HicB family nuclease
MGRTLGGGPASLLGSARRSREVVRMLTDYVRGAMRKAKYEILEDDKSFYGEIPGFQGVYANAATLEECREQLQEVLEEWLLLRISRNMPVPVVNGIDLVIRRVA